MPWDADARKLNFIDECREARLGLWECPSFLVVIMGLTTIASIVVTYFVTLFYTDEPEIVVITVVSVTLILIVLSGVLITSFNRISQSKRLAIEFLSIISHQLRAPLSIFRWTIDAIAHQRKADTTGTTSTAEESSLQTLQVTSDYMINMVNSLLEATRIEARTFVLRKETFPLIEETNTVLVNFKKYAEASNIKISVECESNPSTVYADRERTGIVIQNLIDNAIRYTAVSGNINIKITPVENLLKWSIKDQGIGIPKEEHKHIFKKFFRAGNIKKSYSQTHGSGIGLYIAKEIIEASGGKIDFESEEGRGTTFWFTLPVAKG